MSAIELEDLDSVDILVAVERAFGIGISDAEAESCLTVGDLFNVVMSKVPHAERGALPCPTASTFRRLRKALEESAPNLRITPATQLAELIPARGRGGWWRQLGRSTGLAMPSAWPQDGSSWPWLDTTFGCVVGGLALAAGAGGWSFALAPLAALAFAAVRSVSRSHAAAIGLGTDATVGDLAKITAALNAGLLAQPCGRMRRHEVWTALDGIIRDFNGFSGPIEKRTRFKCV